MWAVRFLRFTIILEATQDTGVARNSKRLAREAVGLEEGEGAGRCAARLLILVAHRISRSRSVAVITLYLILGRMWGSWSMLRWRSFIGARRRVCREIRGHKVRG